MTDPVLKFRRERDEALAKLWTAEDRIRELEALLRELIDIEGPQPGHVGWYRKVQAVLKGSEP